MPFSPEEETPWYREPVGFRKREEAGWSGEEGGARKVLDFRNRPGENAKKKDIPGGDGEGLSPLSRKGFRNRIKSPR